MADTSSNAPSLARTLGFWSLVIYGVGDMLGSGIYALIGQAAGVMGNAVWLAFLTSMVAALLTGLSYASLGSRYPRAAGAAYITQRAFGTPYLSYTLGLAVTASGLTSLAVQARAFAGYSLSLLGAAPQSIVPVALGFILVLALINFWGIRESAALNVVCTTVEVFGLLVVVVVGATYLGSVDYLETPITAAAPAQLTLPLLLQGAVLTFYSFVGFEDMINVSEEVKNPRKNFPWAVLTALFVVTVIYVLVSLTAVSVVNHRELGESTEPLVDVVTRAAPAFPAQAFSLIALFAIMNTGLLNYIMGSRMVYGLARQGLLPGRLGRIHAVRRTPHVAIFVLMLIVVGLSLVGDIAELASATSVLLLCVFLVVNAALITLKRRPDEPRGAFEIPVLVPIAGIVTCAVMLFHAQLRAVLIALALLSAISFLYLIMRPKKLSPNGI